MIGSGPTSNAFAASLSVPPTPPGQGENSGFFQRRRGGEVLLEPDQWDAVLSRITGTVYRGTERISSATLLNLLEVGPDPVTRQKVAKR